MFQISWGNWPRTEGILSPSFSLTLKKPRKQTKPCNKSLTGVKCKFPVCSLVYDASMRHLFDVIQRPFIYPQLIQLSSFSKNSIKMSNFYIFFWHHFSRLSQALLKLASQEWLWTSWFFCLHVINAPVLDTECRVWQEPYKLRYIPNPSIDYC